MAKINTKFIDGVRNHKDSDAWSFSDYRLQYILEKDDFICKIELSCDELVEENILDATAIRTFRRFSGADRICTAEGLLVALDQRVSLRIPFLQSKTMISVLNVVPFAIRFLFDVFPVRLEERLEIALFYHFLEPSYISGRKLLVEICVNDQKIGRAHV